ncbi:MAG TPA: hypothetical protein VGO56_06725 [Pyrinomonadaceae bacterium]|jgi:hypothetical protein|nr:hypothetical protein [Pyrinomonadaceae bacterium]
MKIRTPEEESWMIPCVIPMEPMDRICYARNQTNVLVKLRVIKAIAVALGVSRRIGTPVPRPVFEKVAQRFASWRDGKSV